VRLINKTFKISTPGANPCYLRKVSVANKDLDVLIKRSRRKTMALHVYPDKPVELRVPMKCPWLEIDQFLDSRLGWIEDAQKELSNVPRVPAPVYTEGALHDYLGSKYPLMLVRGRPNHVEQFPGAIVVRCLAPEKSSLVERHMDAWYRVQARALFPERIEHNLKQFPVQLPYRSLVVRKMKARWGSCSRNGDICLNSLLVRLPEAAIDFVITHELCHLQHFSHNKSFYRLLTRVMPDWREREKLLGP
jgi:predicted metal-dependent hydrolase